MQTSWYWPQMYWLNVEQPGVQFIDVTLEIPRPPQTPTGRCAYKVRREKETYHIYGEGESLLMLLVSKARLRKALNDFN